MNYMAEYKKTLHTKEAAYLAASELFFQYGYIGTTVKKICDRCGMKLGTFTYHYAGKDELAVQIYKNLVDNISDYAYSLLFKLDEVLSDQFMTEITVYRAYFSVINQSEASRRFYRELCNSDEFLSTNYKMNISYIENIVNCFCKENPKQFYPEAEINLPVIATLVSGMEIRFAHDLFSSMFAEKDDNLLIDEFLFSYYSMFYRDREDLRKRIRHSRELVERMNLHFNKSFFVIQDGLHTEE